MHLPNRPPARRGAILPLVAVSMLAIFGFVALAVDLGMIMVARNHCQNAADSAALTGVRTVNGDPANDFRIPEMPRQVLTAAQRNPVVGGNITTDADKYAPGDYTAGDWQWDSGDVKIELGSYVYEFDSDNPTNEGFRLNFPRQSDEAYGAIRATVRYDAGQFSFARIWGLNSFETGATATAVHRPRDVVVILDLSGSMGFQSHTGTPMSGNKSQPWSNNNSRDRSLNPDPDFPRFGHYSNVSAARLQGTTSYLTSGNESVDPCNVSVASDSGPPILEFYFTDKGATTKAFRRELPGAYTATPKGDNFARKDEDDAGEDYAVHVDDIYDVDDDDRFAAEFEKDGYDALPTRAAPEKQFKGYSIGPSYWGKTFYMWPPDPRGTDLPVTPANYADNGAKDWRKRFFIAVNDDTGEQRWLDDNRLLYDSNGRIRAPGPWNRQGNSKSNTVELDDDSDDDWYYRINYAAIIKWLKDTGTNPFPTSLCGGGILYYDQLPDETDAGLNDRLWFHNWDSVGDDQRRVERFWRDYIDMVLGAYHMNRKNKENYFYKVRGNNNGARVTEMIGAGGLYSWGSVRISKKPEIDDVDSYAVAPSAFYIASGGTYLLFNEMSETPTAGSTIRVDTDWDGNFNDEGDEYKIIQSFKFTYSAIVYDVIELETPLNDNVQSGKPVEFTEVRYMDYRDNPRRPRLQYWFGGLTLQDYLSNDNTDQRMVPGTAPEAQNWACKVGMQTALEDIKNNHPNDFVGLIFFNKPKNNKNSKDRFNRARVALRTIGDRDQYSRLVNSLWFPPAVVNDPSREVWYDEDDLMRDAPRAGGSTAPVMAFRLAYNQFSSSTVVSDLRLYSKYAQGASPTPSEVGIVGGMGRKGAQKIVIFETDGVPNTGASAAFVKKGNADDNQSYYRVRIRDHLNWGDGANEFPNTGGGYSQSDLFGVVTTIANPVDHDTNPGYSTPRRPVLIHSIGYGTLFDSSKLGSSAQESALRVLQGVQYRGNTADTDAISAFPDYKMIYGTADQRIAKMKNAFTRIMQDSVSVTLIE